MCLEFKIKDMSSNFLKFMMILSNSGPICVQFDKHSEDNMIVISFKQRKPIRIEYEAAQYLIKRLHVEQLDCTKYNHVKISDKMLTLELFLVANPVTPRKRYT